MKSSTAKNRYLGKVKRRAERFSLLTKFLKENNIDIYDPYLPYSVNHLRTEFIQIKSDIHWNGFKYRLEVDIPRSKD
jgi:hypothetical protein